MASFEVEGPLFCVFLLFSVVLGLPTTSENQSSLQVFTTSIAIAPTKSEERKWSTATTVSILNDSTTIKSEIVQESRAVEERSNSTITKPETDLKAEVSSLKNKRKEDEELPLALPQKDTKSGYQRDDGTYVIEDSADTPCILAYFKAQITVYYPTDRKREKYTNAAVRPPDDVEVSGKCDRDSLIAILDLTWEQGVFSLRFAFDDLTDSWYVDQFSFVFNTSMSAYSSSDKVEKVSLKSIENKRFWATSHARSFRCLLLHDVNLMDEIDLYSATIHFDEARVQAFTKTENFKTPKHCIHRVHRDEMVPVTVGGVLAGLTLVTISIYGGFRYFKIKKFQYGTME